jgi:hypothetical protein
VRPISQGKGAGLERRRALSSEVPSRHFVWVFSSIAPTRRSLSYYFFAACISLFGSKLGSKIPAPPGRSPVPKKRPCPRETKPYFSDNQLGLAVSFHFRKALVRRPAEALVGSKLTGSQRRPQSNLNWCKRFCSAWIISSSLRALPQIALISLGFPSAPTVDCPTLPHPSAEVWVAIPVARGARQSSSGIYFPPAAVP